MGDSLADSGTFGLKFTVQGSAGTGAGSTPIWPELVAQEVSDADALCAYNRVNPLTQAATVQAGCTNYAVGGGRIVSVRQSHPDGQHEAGAAPQVAGDQRCGSNSSIRLAGCVGKRSSTSLKYA